MSDETTEHKPFIDLSLTQLIGSSAAAVTAAALGSRLGTVGTIIGAGFASIISAVAAAIYTSSLRRTQDLIRTRDLKLPGTRTSSQPVTDARSGESAVEKDGEPESVPAVLAEADGTDAVGQDLAKASVWERVRWKTVAITAAVVFLVAGLVVTGTELVTGKSLSGSQGTTVGNAVHHRSGGSGRSPTPTPSAPTSTATHTPSARTTAEPTSPLPESPTGSASSTPTSTPSDDSSSTPTPAAPGASVSGGAAPEASATSTP